MQSLVELAEQLNNQNNTGFVPVCFQLNNNADFQAFNSILTKNPSLQVNNNIIPQTER